MGAHPGATGFLDESLFPTLNPAELESYKRQGEIDYMGSKTAQAKRWIARNPLQFAKLTARRTIRFWCGAGTHDGSPFFVVHALLTTVLGGLGLCSLWRSGQRYAFTCFAVPMLLFPLPYYITHAEFRYRLVLDPVLCVMAARGLGVLAGLWPRSSTGETTARASQSWPPCSTEPAPAAR